MPRKSGNIPSKLSKDEFLCPHCNNIVTKSTYYNHKSLFFRRNKWITTSDRAQNEHKESNTSLNSVNHLLENATEQLLVNDPTQAIYPISEIAAECNQLEKDEECVPSEIWTNSEEPSIDFNIDNDTASLPQINFILPLIYLLFKWQSKYYISDSAILKLLLVIKYVLGILQIIIQSNKLEAILADFPTSLTTAKKILGFSKDSFVKFVCCPKCCKLYQYNDCVNFFDQVKRCDNVRFPDHSQERFRQPCNEVLMKKVMSIDNKKTYLYPRNVYAYTPLKHSLQLLLKRKHLLQTLLTKPNQNTNDIMLDIHDGDVWKTFKYSDNSLYFSNPRNLAVMLNIDWFQPYSNIEHSVGVIYLAILNLPRETRFKKENTLIVGIIPGPKEPEHNVNSFLKPLMTELKLFWSGIYLKEHGLDKKYRIALISVSSDLPATRKCCGFLSFHALKGCSKCFKTFPRNFGEKADFSGYEIDEWEPRNKEDHIRISNLQKNAKTKTEQQAIEKAYGVRYSELSRLHYYEPIRYHLVDPMHNILLGVTKHFFITLIDIGIVEKDKLEQMDISIKELNISTNIGRFPTSLHYHKSFKAEEWKIWLLHLSLYCYRKTIPRKYYNIWQIFVRACKLLLVKDITKTEVETAHTLFVLYCKKFEEKISSYHCTPNMHMLLHMKSCVLDFGPVYGFWCFAFERQNGILGAHQTNNRSITIQLMRKFLEGSFLDASADNFLGENAQQVLTDVGLASSVDINYNLFSNLVSIRRSEVVQQSSLFLEYNILSIMSIQCLSSDEVILIADILNTVFTSLDLQHVTSFVNEFNRVQIGDEIYVSEKYRGGTSPNKFVMARFGLEKNIRPCIISSIFDVKVVVRENGVSKTITIPFLKLKFMKEHPLKYYYGRNCPMEVWNSTFEDIACSFAPLCSIMQKCVTAKVNERFNHIPMYDGYNFRGSDVVYFVVA